MQYYIYMLIISHVFLIGFAFGESSDPKCSSESIELLILLCPLIPVYLRVLGIA